MNTLTNEIADENLKKDPLFYQRKTEIQQIMDDIDSGKCELLTHAEHKQNMQNFFDELNKKDGYSIQQSQ